MSFGELLRQHISPDETWPDHIPEDKRWKTGNAMAKALGFKPVAFHNWRGDRQRPKEGFARMLQIATDQLGWDRDAAIELILHEPENAGQVAVRVKPPEEYFIDDLGMPVDLVQRLLDIASQKPDERRWDEVDRSPTEVLTAELGMPAELVARFQKIAERDSEARESAWRSILAILDISAGIGPKPDR